MMKNNQYTAVTDNPTRSNFVRYKQVLPIAVLCMSEMTAPFDEVFPNSRIKVLQQSTQIKIISSQSVSWLMYFSNPTGNM
jgi:hypothetical protein